MSEHERGVEAETQHDYYHRLDPNRLWSKTLEDRTEDQTTTNIPASPSHEPSEADAPGEAMEDIQGCLFGVQDVRGFMPDRMTAEAECPHEFEVEATERGAESPELSKLSSGASMNALPEGIGRTWQDVACRHELQRLRTDQAQAERMRRKRIEEGNAVAERSQLLQEIVMEQFNPADEATKEAIQKVVNNLQKCLDRQGRQFRSKPRSKDKSMADAMFVKHLSNAKDLIDVTIEQLLEGDYRVGGGTEVETTSTEDIASGEPDEEPDVIHHWRIDRRRYLEYQIAPLDSDVSSRRWMRAVDVGAKVGPEKMIAMAREFVERCHDEAARMEHFVKDTYNGWSVLHEENEVSQKPDPFKDTEEIMEKRERRRNAMQYWNTFKPSVVGAEFEQCQKLMYWTIDVCETKVNLYDAQFMPSYWDGAIDAFLKRKQTEWRFQVRGAQ